MAKLSKNQRRIIGETVRQTVANLGFGTPIKHGYNHGGVDDSKSNHDSKEPQKNSLFDIICEGITTGFSGLLFILFSGGIINYFGQFPQILNFGAWGLNVLLLFGACKMVFFHSSRSQPK